MDLNVKAPLCDACDPKHIRSSGGFFFLPSLEVHVIILNLVKRQTISLTLLLSLDYSLVAFTETYSFFFVLAESISSYRGGKLWAAGWSRPGQEAEREYGVCKEGGASLGGAYGTRRRSRHGLHLWWVDPLGWILSQETEWVLNRRCISEILCCQPDGIFVEWSKLYFGLIYMKGN